MLEPEEPVKAYLTCSPEALAALHEALMSVPVSNGPPPEPTFIETVYGCNPVADRLEELADRYRTVPGELRFPVLAPSAEDFAELCDLVAKIARAM